ncbi:cytosine permease [Streptomyces sp. NPDC048275]|uniref:cytosine permease n=1 Tax=Streptomyces sp. NPDC048275 TaxID=3155629 RepID=UPI00340BF0CF
MTVVEPRLLLHPGGRPAAVLGLSMLQSFAVLFVGNLFWALVGLLAVSGPSTGAPSTITTRAMYGVRGNRVATDPQAQGTPCRGCRDASPTAGGQRSPRRRTPPSHHGEPELPPATHRAASQRPHPPGPAPPGRSPSNSGVE